jgi:hypothetical protein
MMSSMIRCQYCIFWQLLFKVRIVENLIPDGQTCKWKKCHFKCNRLHQPMYTLWLKFDYFKFDKKKPTLIFPPNMSVLQVQSKNP